MRDFVKVIHISPFAERSKNDQNQKKKMEMNLSKKRMTKEPFPAE
jgi:hypothetical protein